MLLLEGCCDIKQVWLFGFQPAAIVRSYEDPPFVYIYIFCSCLYIFILDLSHFITTSIVTLGNRYCSWVTLHRKAGHPKTVGNYNGCSNIYTPPKSRKNMTLQHMFARKSGLPYGQKSKGNFGYPSSCSQNITPYCPIKPLYKPYIGGRCWYISRVLSHGYPVVSSSASRKGRRDSHPQDWRNWCVARYRG